MTRPGRASKLIPEAAVADSLQGACAIGFADFYPAVHKITVKDSCTGMPGEACPERPCDTMEACE